MIIRMESVIFIHELKADFWISFPIHQILRRKLIQPTIPKWYLSREKDPKKTTFHTFKGTKYFLCFCGRHWQEWLGHSCSWWTTLNLTVTDSESPDFQCDHSFSALTGSSAMFVGAAVHTKVHERAARDNVCVKPAVERSNPLLPL